MQQINLMWLYHDIVNKIIFYVLFKRTKLLMFLKLLDSVMLSYAASWRQ